MGREASTSDAPVDVPRRPRKGSRPNPRGMGARLDRPRAAVCGDSSGFGWYVRQRAGYRSNTGLASPGANRVVHVDPVERPRQISLALPRPGLAAPRG
jgi:hypothetical protein